MTDETELKVEVETKPEGDVGKDDSTPAKEPKTFTEDYVKELREEAKQNRLRAEEAQRKLADREKAERQKAAEAREKAGEYESLYADAKARIADLEAQIADRDNRLSSYEAAEGDIRKELLRSFPKAEQEILSKLSTPELQRLAAIRPKGSGTSQDLRQPDKAGGSKANGDPTPQELDEIRKTDPKRYAELLKILREKTRQTFAGR